MVNNILLFQMQTWMNIYRLGHSIYILVETCQTSTQKEKLYEMASRLCLLPKGHLPKIWAAATLWPGLPHEIGGASRPSGVAALRFQDHCLMLLIKWL